MLRVRLGGREAQYKPCKWSVNWKEECKLMMKKSNSQIVLTYLFLTLKKENPYTLIKWVSFRKYTNYL